MIFDERYLFVFFGMSSETLLTNSIEWLDLENRHFGFRDFVMPKPARGTGLFFDKSLYLSSGSQLSNGLELVIFGGARGDGNDSLESDVFKLSLSLENGDSENQTRVDH